MGKNVLQINNEIMLHELSIKRSESLVIVVSDIRYLPNIYLKKSPMCRRLNSTMNKKPLKLKLTGNGDL